MTQNLYACVHAEEFPAQALLRLRSDLQSQPVAVLDGRRRWRPSAPSTVRRGSRAQFPV